MSKTYVNFFEDRVEVNGLVISKDSVNVNISDFDFKIGRFIHIPNCVLSYKAYRPMYETLNGVNVYLSEDENGWCLDIQFECKRIYSFIKSLGYNIEDYNDILERWF